MPKSEPYSNIRHIISPTPVSALLHAATLVAGGTYLLLRCSAIVSISNIALILAAIFGTITAILAASTALFQYDMKRIIAYSTMSQFGYLTASIGLGQTSSTLFHLSSHSGFKALLFITAGGVIHSTSDQQDIRKLGGLLSFLPFTYAGMLIGSLSLIATPYLSGFYSKDLILELGAAQWSLISYWMWILGSLVAGITACYSIRLLGYIYLGVPSGSKKTYELTHEQSFATIVSIISLSLLAIAFGYFAREPIVGLGNYNLKGIDPISSSYLIEADFGLTIIKKNLPFISTIIGTATGIILFILPFTMFNNVFNRKPILNLVPSLDLLKNIHSSSISQGVPLNYTYLPSFFKEAKKKEGTQWPNLGLEILDKDQRTHINGPLAGKNWIKMGIASLSNKWWIDAIYAKMFTWPGLDLGNLGSKWVDRGLIELLGPTQLSYVLFPEKNDHSFSLANLTKTNKIFNTPLLQPSKAVVPTSLLVPDKNGEQDWAKVKGSFAASLKTERWIGSTLPDYSSYIIFFIVISILIISIVSFNYTAIQSLPILFYISIIFLFISISAPSFYILKFDRLVPSLWPVFFNS